MARLVDVIEAMIKELIEENNGSATISRSVLAERANCVPSQVTYVLSTRFSTGSGYIVESRRGGGGQITITQISLAPPPFRAVIYGHASYRVRHDADAPELGHAFIKKFLYVFHQISLASSITV